MSLLDTLRAQPPGPPVAPANVDRVYRRWRVQSMAVMIVGYALYYFVRKNLSMAMPGMREELGYTRTDLGLILTVFSVLYGLGKFLNGMLADRANARYFMAIGLLGAAAVNVMFGMASSLMFMGIFWIANAWFQSMGWPPCARLLTHWYGKREIGTWWGFWNASHMIGGAGILVLAGWLVENYGWRSAFYVPAAIAGLGGVFLIAFLRDTPRSLGLPPIEEYRPDTDDGAPEPEEDPLTLKEILLGEVLGNPAVWLMCAANFFIYIVRIGMLDWGPTFLVEAKNSALTEGGWQVAGFEIGGILGGLVAGFVSDRVFKGHRTPVNILFVVALIGSALMLWLLPGTNVWRDGLILFCIGVLVYGPQMLTTVAVTDASSKQAAGTATGFVGLFGYLGSAVCGVGTGMIVDRYGWDGGFMFYVGSAVCALVVYLWALRLDRMRR